MLLVAASSIGLFNNSEPPTVSFLQTGCTHRSLPPRGGVPMLPVSAVLRKGLSDAGLPRNQTIAAASVHRGRCGQPV
jgi:hypothetical protein